MNNELRKIESFTDLYVWQHGHELVLKVYVVTKNFPKDEQFGLTNQVRRAVISITSNIAEGFSRNSYKEKLQFYSIALGSLTEVQNQLLIAKDVGYLEADIFTDISDKAVICSKLLNGLIKTTKSFIHNS